MNKPEYWESDEIQEQYLNYLKSLPLTTIEKKSKISLIIESIRHPPINEQIDFLNKLSLLLYKNRK